MQIQSYSYSPTNAELVAGCLQGDATAWDKLVERYARLVRSVPARHGLTRDDVDDITQDVFLSLARNLDQIQDTESIGKWLLVTARHRSWRVAEKLSKEQPVAVGDFIESDDLQFISHSVRPLPGLTELTELWSQREIISYGMEKLGKRCRRLLYMLFLDPEQPTYETVCDELNMAKGSIGPTRKRCLEQLRSILDGYEETNAT